ncbi:MAG: membrane protein insertase YidC [Verrucomicrobiota bacterium]|nr:membrane protein insertase YidC [Verrucomicrobiota bacterium]
MDRTAWVAIFLCVAGLVGWEVWSAKQHLPPAPMTAATAAASPTPAALPSATPVPTPTPTATPEIASFAEKSETLRNSDMELHLTNRGGGISEVVFLDQVDDSGAPVRLNSPTRLPIGAFVETPGAATLPEFTMTREGDSVVMTRAATNGVSVKKTFSFPPTTEKRDNYLVALDVELKNTSAARVQQPEYFISLGSAAPLHPRDFPTYTRLAWCENGAGKGINVSWFGAQTIPIVGIQKRAAMEFYREKIVKGAEWAGVANQFFTTLITPLNGPGVELWGQRFVTGENGTVPVYGIEGALALPQVDLAPGEVKTLHFQIYSGPKIYRRLAQLSHHEAEIMDFGMFKLVCQALLNFMNLLQHWVGNYGIAIVLMTVCVKAVLWPLQNKANRSMRRMSQLSPKMQELRAKYKDDPTKMNAEVMKLYKEYGVNPVGGCLPMLIQFPIFIGLYTMLRQAAELRNAHFLWVHDLSQPDTLFTIPGLGWIPIIGNPTGGLAINIFPILMGASQFLLMKMTPKTGDPTQQRIMMFMPLIFLLFCYNFAAALALYYTTQNLLSILQFWHNQRQPAPVLAKVTAAKKGARKG